MPVLYDQFGRQVDLSALAEEKAYATLTGVRNIWAEAVASGLTPAKLGRLLEDSANGDARAYLTLAEEMEERELHYAGVLGVRKRAVAALPVQVEAASDDKQDVKIADAVRDLTASPDFEDLAEDLLDAIGKSYSVSEIDWDRSGKEWTPKKYDWRDPRFFVFDQATGRQIRVLTDNDQVYGEPLSPFKFIVHYPRLKTGIPIRGGLARLAAWAYVFKNYSVKDWMAFLEVFGMPPRFGRYDNNATPPEIAVLKAAVANMGHDAAAVFPKSMDIELAEVKGGGGSKSNVFQDMAIYQDRQVAYATLGQTGTTEPTPGSLGNQEAQSDVRRDIRNADAKQLSKTLNRDLVRPFVDLNFGPKKRYPKIVLQTSEPEDLKALADNLAKLVPLGLRVEASEVRDRYNFSDPAPDAECLGDKTQTAEPAPVPVKAQNRAQKDQDTADKYAARLQAEAGELLGDILAPIMARVEAAENLDEIEQILLDAFPNKPPAELGALIGQAMAAADLAGRLEVMDDET